MVTEKIVIHGSLASDDIVDWIIHRARRLGLRGSILHASDHTIEALVSGPVDLIDAMEVGCSLGPISVQVEAIERFPVDKLIVDQTFAYTTDK